MMVASRFPSTYPYSPIRRTASMRNTSEDWPRHFDELQLLQNLRTAGGDEVSGLDELKKDDVVLVCWGKEREQYRAVVRGVHAGKLVLVHYENATDDWDQWVKPRQLIRRK